MSPQTYSLSKSSFLSGVQCEKKFFFDRYRKELKPAASARQEAIFDRGNEIGELAKLVFSGGIDLKSTGDFKLQEQRERTQSLLTQKTPTIYEAAFSENGVFAALDILHHQDGEMWAIEVKSSSSVKDYHLQDASLQYWVMNAAGYTPDRFFVMHLNSDYVKNGPIVTQELFCLSDVTDRIKNNQLWVEQQLSVLKGIDAQEEPQKEIGKHCSDPFDCEYKGHCWRHIPDEDSVFELTNARGRDWDMYAKGILHLNEVPEDELNFTSRQQLQIDGVKYGKRVIDEMAIHQFVESVTYPIYFFDFETINSAVPILDFTSPYQQVPFQYSLHTLLAPDGSLVHSEFLAKPSDFNGPSDCDPRKSLIDQMRNDIGPEGSIMAYNAMFEKGVIKALAEAFPADAEFLLSLIPRFLDLLDVFKAGWYYTPAMKGSASIKYVLPALFPELSYQNLEIGNGEQASAVFLDMITSRFDGNVSETRTHLLAYCKQDTYAMVLLFNELVRVAAGSIED
jgi:hypothetical protein